MSNIGKIRIKSFGMLTAPNSMSPTKEETNIRPELSPKELELCPSTIKDLNTLHSNVVCLPNKTLSPKPSISVKCSDQIMECVDLTLTDDTFESPVKSIHSKKIQLKGSQIKNATTSKANHNTRSKVQIKQNPIEDSSQKKLLTFFTPNLSIKKTTTKPGKPPEQSDAVSILENTPPRKLRKLSLRRNILKDVACENTKSESKVNEESNDMKPNTRSRKAKVLGNEKITKLKSEVEFVAEPTVIPGVIDLCLDGESDEEKKSPIILPKRPVTVKSEKSICPSYKVVEGTTFAVDGFKFGRIEGVTAYFLSHFHSDHYIGLTRKFSMPIYVSQITANLMREFIALDEQYINVLPLNITTTIENVKVTAIDANHCPGAVMFLFQLPCGKRILHTGDFRASIQMESDPHLSQRNIDLLYLDTTYISHNYSFQTQEQSIVNALNLVQEFKEKYEGKRILYVVGAYLVGKEKFWLAIAKKFDFKVWTDSNRRKIMNAIGDKEILERLVNKSQDADMHVISMMKVGFKGIQAYWEDNCHNYDLIFAIRPSGWEKNSKPQYRGQINIVGIEYSEHSSHSELRRFLSFLKPQQVISTVPYGKDLTKCPDVPLSWYKSEFFQPVKKQASMLDYFSSSKSHKKS